MVKIVGTWYLKKMSLERESCETIFPFGENAKGLMIYNLDGYMSGMISGENRPNVSSPAIFGIEASEREKIGKNFIAYSGKYKVKGEKIIHNVEVSFIPNLMDGRDHTSFFKINENELVISSKFELHSGENISLALIWGKIDKQ